MSRLQTFSARARHAAIRIGLEAINLIPPALQRGPWTGRGIVFTLHHVRPAQTHPFQPNAILSITPQFLDSAIGVALECGLTPVRLEDVPALLADDGAPRFFAVTLDDGYRNNAQYAAPVFARYGVPYTIFATAGFWDRSRTPWWEVAERMLQRSETLTFDFGDGERVHPAGSVAQKQALFSRLAAFVNTNEEDAAIGRIDAAALRCGVVPVDLLAELVMDAGELRDLAARDPLASIGAHSLTHSNFARLDAERLRTEIEGSVAAVEALTGVRPKAFAYPYGWSTAAGEREARAVADAGLAVGVTTRPGVLKGGAATNMHLLPRISLNGFYQQPRFVRALITGLPFLFR
ncbi:MAG: polysaccharide deacetylase family protein [Rhizobiaceae bacterium]|nr:polysaccharide deacetylase family protein [Rhizobiaceae bacterium]